MTSTTVVEPEPGLDAEFYDYRAISKAVVFGVVLSFAGLAGLLTPMLLILPAIGLASALIGLARIRRYPEELTGTLPGRVAVTLSTLVLVGGGAWHWYEYSTEVPDDAQRVAFWELMADERPGQPRIPAAALQLDGQRVFIKGYVHPAVQDAGPVDHFLMVGDLGTCCYGGQPKLTHMIDVRLSNDLKIKYSYRKRSLAGILRVDPTPKSPDGQQGACYFLEADYLK